jgi:hypothetical protein
MSYSFLVTKETAVVGPGCLSGLQGLVAMFGCNVWLQCLVIRFGYMGYNRQLVETKTARSARLVLYLQNPFQIINLREKIKTIFLCWKDFTNYIYRVKKESINNNYNGLQGIGPKVRRSRSVYLQTLPNREFERENKNHLSLLETFYKLFYWIKKRISKHLLDNMVPNNRYSCSDYMVLFFGYMNRVKNRQLDETKTGLRPDRLICKTLSKS